MGSRIVDHSPKLSRQMKRNIKAALTGMGIEAVSLIQNGMDTIYVKPIWDTGDLHRDVSYNVHPESADVDVGNSLKYSLYVHEGTSRMAARPYITDSLQAPYSVDRLKQIAAQELKRGM